MVKPGWYKYCPTSAPYHRWVTVISETTRWRTYRYQPEGHLLAHVPLRNKGRWERGIVGNYEELVPYTPTDDEVVELVKWLLAGGKDEL